MAVTDRWAAGCAKARYCAGKATQGAEENDFHEVGTAFDALLPVEMGPLLDIIKKTVSNIKPSDMRRVVAADSANITNAERWRRMARLQSSSSPPTKCVANARRRTSSPGEHEGLLGLAREAS